jgi:GntR family transcriptional regulator
MFKIDERSLSPIYEQIVEQVKELVAKGALKEGDRIPSVREMSSLLLVNHNTVAKAYQELERQRVIASQRGKGAFVTKSTSEPGMEKERLRQLREGLRRIAVEAHHLGISKERLAEWLAEEIQQYGRERDADRSESS